MFRMTLLLIVSFLLIDLTDSCGPSPWQVHRSRSLNKLGKVAGELIFNTFFLVREGVFDAQQIL